MHRIAMLLALGAVLGCPQAEEPAVVRELAGAPSLLPPQAIPQPLPLSSPARIALAPDGVLYVSDPVAGAVFGYREGERVFTLSSLDRPLGLAVLGDRLLVGDDGRKTVSAHARSDGRLLGLFGAGPGEVSMPNAIAVSPDGDRVYVADSRANLIRVYDGAGRAIGAFGAEGDRLRFPVALAVDSRTVVVADQGHHRLQIFEPQGRWLRSFGGLPPRAAHNRRELRGRMVRPQGVALVEGKIAVLDSAFGLVQLFTPSGESLGFTGNRGDCVSCIDLGLDLAWDATARAFVLSDPNRHRWVSAPLLLRELP